MPIRLPPHLQVYEGIANSFSQCKPSAIHVSLTGKLTTDIAMHQAYF